MPYIKKEKRKYADRVFKHIAHYFFLEPITGNLNYLLFKLAKEQCNSYKEFQEFIGELECAKLEIYRRLLTPYEDKKIKENGDVE